MVQAEHSGFVWMPQLVEHLAQLRVTVGGKLDREAQLDSVVGF